MTASESFSVKEKDKLLSFSTRSFSSTDNQYSNLNMNKRHNCANLNNMSGISSCTNNRHPGYGLSKDDYHVSKSMQSGRWRKSNPSLNLSHSYFSDKDVDEKGIKKTKDSSVKNSSTLSLHIAAYENAIEASDLKQKNSSAEASESTAKAAWKSKKFCDSSSTIAFSIFDGFEFPRQQQDGPQEPSFMHFTSSQRLISPNANVAPASVQPSPSIVTTPAASQASQGGANPTVFVYTQGQFFRENADGSEDEVIFLFNKDSSFVGDGELDPISIEWDGQYLFAVFLDDNAPDEIIHGLKLSDKLEIVTDQTYKGPYTQLLFLVNRVTDERIENPDDKSLYKFLVDFKNGDDTGQNDDEGSQMDISTSSSQMKKEKKPKNMASSVFEKTRLIAVKAKIARLADSLPEPQLRYLPINSLIHDTCIRNVSAIGAQLILNEIQNGTLKADHFSSLLVNQVDEKYYVIQGNKRLKAMKEFRYSNPGDPQFEFVKCHVYTDLDYTQKLLIGNPSSVSQGSTTTIQKLKLLRQVMDELMITLPKGKEMEKYYSDIMNNLYHNDYSPILNDLIELPSQYLDQLFQIQCGNIPLEEMHLENDFWKCFVNSVKKNPLAALSLLAELETKPAKDVAKILFKKVEVDLLHFLSERGSHTFESEEAAILYFTNDPQCTKADLMKIFTAIRIDHNKGKTMGRYNWKSIKSNIAKHLTEDYAFQNAKFVDKLDVGMIEQQDFILVQNPIKPHLDFFKTHGQKAVIVLIGNYGDPAPEIPQLTPTAVIKIVMEDPLLIDKLLTALPDPVVNVSLYIPGAPTTNQDDRTLYLTSVARKFNCCLASTMTLQNGHELAKLAEKKEKAALCFVSEKVATLFLSKCSCFTEISVVGDPSLKAIVQTLVSPPAKKTKTAKNNDDSTNDE